MTTDPTHVLNPRAGCGTKRWWARLIGVWLLLGGAVPLVTLAESIEAQTRLDGEASYSTEFSEPLACSLSRLPLPDRPSTVAGYASAATGARRAARPRQPAQRSGHRLANGLMAPLRN